MSSDKCRVTRKSGHDPFAGFLKHFNARRYRDALLAVEQCWLADRNQFYQGLVQLCCALNQMQLGHASGPKFLLARARQRLSSFAPRHHQLNIARIIMFIEQCEPLVSEDEQPVEPPAFILRRLPLKRKAPRIASRGSCPTDPSSDSSSAHSITRRP